MPTKKCLFGIMILPFEGIFPLLNIRQWACDWFCELFAVNIGIHPDGITVTETMQARPPAG
jgi:hypothetical protein